MGERLTTEEEAAVVAALAALDAGQGLSLTEVIREIWAHRPR